MSKTTKRLLMLYPIPIIGIVAVKCFGESGFVIGSDLSEKFWLWCGIGACCLALVFVVRRSAGR